MKTRESKQSREQSNTTARESLQTVSYSVTATQSEQSQKVSNTMIQKTAEQKAIEQKIAKYSKLSFNDSSHHECNFNRASYTDDKLAFIVTDKKYYKSCERVDTVTMSRATVESKLSKIALFDRIAFERALEDVATFELCCNSKAVALNLTQHERKYSTLYRHLALYAHRADLYLMSMMSDKQRASAFNSSHFLKAVELQAKAFTAEQIQKATTSNKLYSKAVEQLKKLLLTSKTAKVNTAKLITAKAKAVESKAKATTTK